MTVRRKTGIERLTERKSEANIGAAAAMVYHR